MTPKQTAKLTKEQYERFEEKFTDSEYDREGNRVGYFLLDDYHEDVKQFLADELQRQREEIEAKLNEIMDDDSISMLENNLQIAFGQNECKVCGYNPRHQKEYLMQELFQTTNEEQK